jgi:multiple sugar transport system substrate-binding protein
MAQKLQIEISRRSFLKSSLALASAGILSAACVAAPPAAAPQAAQPAPAGKLKEMKLTTWENWEKDEGFLKAWDTFYQKTGVKIAPEHIPWSGYPDKIVTLAAANSMPDILRVNGHMTPVFGYRDLLLKLNPFIDKDNYDMEMYYPLLRRIYQYPEGEQLCLPQDNANYAGTYYNVQLLEEAGLEPPGDDWTYDDLLVYAERLTKKEGDRTIQYGMYVVEGGGYPSPGVIAFGGQMSDDNFAPTKANIDSAEHRDLFNYVLQATDKGVHPTLDAIGELGGGAQALATGKVGLVVNQGLWVSNQLVDAPNLKWDIVVSPRRPDKPHRFATAGAGWGAPAASKDPDLAWEFLKFFMGPEGTEIVLAGRRPDFVWPSAIKKYSEKEATDKGGAHPNLLKAVQAAENIIPWWALHPNVEQIWTTILSPISDQILRKEKAIDEGLAEMQTKMQELLDKLPAKS